MALEIKPVQRPQWTPLPHEGCEGVFAKVLLKTEVLGLAMLRFEPNSTIHEHAADIDIDVICIEGAGMTSVGSESAPIKAGEWVRWPAGEPHRLWVTDSKMITLMVEHHQSPGDAHRSSRPTHL